MQLSYSLNVSISCLLLIVMVNGCSIFYPPKQQIQTKVIPVQSGKSTKITEFKVGGEKPYAYVIWENDVRDRAECKITITNVLKATRVYQRDFIHDKNTNGSGYNYERGKIVENNPQWNRQIGEYLMELYVDGKRKSYYTFYIRP